MKPNLFWIERPGPGRLAILARPRGGDWLEDEVLSWKNAGVNVLVSALTPEEVLELELENEKSFCQTHGIAFYSFPIDDRDVPSSITSTRELAVTLEQALLRGKSVAIHCRQGVGRSSLLAASVLVLEGIDSEAAFASISRVRGCLVPDTAEQRQWVTRFARESFKIASML
jgi:protein-tyrosine phosphatase